MGEMADFTNDGLMDEIEAMENMENNPQELYEAGFIDEFGFPVQPFKGQDLVPPPTT